MNNIDLAYSALYTGAIIVFALLIITILIRAVIGPKIADRLMAINMIGTLTIIMMSIVAVILEEDYLLDISIIYAMISFISVVILSKVYMGVHAENIKRKQEGRKTVERIIPSDKVVKKRGDDDIPSLSELMKEE